MLKTRCAMCSQHSWVQRHLVNLTIYVGNPVCSHRSPAHTQRDTPKINVGSQRLCDNKRSVNPRVDARNPMCSHRIRVQKRIVNLNVDVVDPLCSQRPWVKKQFVIVKFDVGTIDAHTTPTAQKATRKIEDLCWTSPLAIQNTPVQNQHVNLKIALRTRCAHGTPKSRSALKTKKHRCRKPRVFTPSLAQIHRVQNHGAPPVARYTQTTPTKQ